jgi:hypothetical protein
MQYPDPHPLVIGMDPRMDPDPDPHQNVMDPQHCKKQYPSSRVRINGVVFTSYVSLTGHTRRVIRCVYHFM